MALTNVAHWTNEGWKSITIEEATKIYPSKVSVHSGLFMCRLCKKYITLTAPGRNASGWLTWPRCGSPTCPGGNKARKRP